MVAIRKTAAIRNLLKIKLLNVVQIYLLGESRYLTTVCTWTPISRGDISTNEKRYKGCVSMPRASLRSVLLICAFNTARMCRVSTQITGKPASASAL